MKRMSEEASSGVSTLVWDGTNYLQGRLTPYVNAAAYDSQSIPTQMNASATAVITVAVRNTGTSTWTQAAQFLLGSDSPMDNLTWGLGRCNFSGAETIAPGQLKTFTFTITAPATAGTYPIQWRMLQEGVGWFGVPSPISWIKVI